METTLSGPTPATEKFNNGTLEDKKQVLSALGSNLFWADEKNASEEAVYQHWCGTLYRVRTLLLYHS